MSGSDKVVPPKKSKAARKTEVLPDEAPGAESTEVQEQNGHVDDLAGKSSDAASGSGQDQEPSVNIFQQEIVEGKRKRNAPLAEQTMLDWLKKNFVEKENAFLLLNDMYQSYLEACSSVAAFAMDYTHFHKAVTQMFPKGQALVEDSPYKDTIREKKAKKKSTTKIQADSLHLKMKDIIKEAITDLGNPRKGIGFSAIKNLVAGKFPALRVDLRVNILKNAIFRELRFGHIECVRGIGACGYYRLPRTPEQEAEEVEAEKKEAQEKALKKKGKKDATATDEKTDENADAEKTGAEAEDAEKKDEEKPAETEEASNEKPAKKKKKTKKRKKPQNDYYAAHSEPQHIEDTFALAMTYNSEPKEASVAKIRKYIKDFYKEDISIEKLKKCLDTGVEHGFWFQVTGHGSGSGSFRLTINEFDPLADDDLTGKVMNAIVACTEPKQSSALLLKKYVQDYHPNFRVAERPYLFKMSLQRAVNKNMIVQLSGIGATGTFQLVDPFLPSPTVLQGKDTASDYGESDVEVAENVEAFQDAYKPRPTKRRGMGRVAATAIRRLDVSAKTPASPQTGSRAAKGRGAKKAVTGRGGRNAGKKNAPSSDEESEDEESEEEPPKKTPVKRKAPTPRPAPGKAKKAKVVVASSAKKPTARRATPAAASAPKKAAAAASESESEEYDSEPEAYTPRRTTSRGGSSAPSASAAGRVGRGGKGRSAPSPARKAPPPAKGKKKVDKEESEEENEDSEEEKPQATPARKGKPAGKGKGGRKGKKAKTPARKPPARGKAKEPSESESEEEPAAVPVTPKSGTQSGRRPGSAARMQAQPPSEDDDEKKESGSAKLAKSSGLKVTVVLTAPKRGSAGGGKQVHKVTRISPPVNAKASEDEEEEEDEKPEPAKKPKFGKSPAAGKKKKGGKKAKSRK